MLARTAQNISKMGPLRNIINLYETYLEKRKKHTNHRANSVQNPRLDTNPYFHKIHFYENQSKEDDVPNQKLASSTPESPSSTPESP